MLKRILLSSMVIVGLAGCSGQETKPEKQRPAPIEPASSTEKAPDHKAEALPFQPFKGSKVEIIPITEAEGGQVQPLKQDEVQSDTQPVQLIYEPVVYFGYDSDTVSDEGREVLKYYAEKLLEQPEVRVRLEGHTDERGSPEYNLALGERRAKAVKEVLVLYGVAPERIEVISYGETHPAVEGHDETAWAKNRRVELVFVQ